MIDAGEPDYYSKLSAIKDMESTFSYARMLRNIGIHRLLVNMSPEFITLVNSNRNNLSLIPEELRKIDNAMFLKTQGNKNFIEELKNLKTNAFKVLENGRIDDIPLRIITSEISSKRPLNGDEWENSQEAFKEWSTDSKQITVNEAEHYIHQYAPNIINKEILEILNN